MCATDDESIKGLTVRKH